MVDSTVNMLITPLSQLCSVDIYPSKEDVEVMADSS